MHTHTHTLTHAQVPRLVSTAILRAEVKRVLRLVSLRLRRPAPEPLDIYPDNPRVSLLLKWVQAVGMLHGLRVHNFTSSFGDGRALCYLVCALTHVCIACCGFEGRGRERVARAVRAQLHERCA